MPSEVGDWHTVYGRLSRRVKAVVVEQVAVNLQHEALADNDLDTLVLDITIAKFHAHGTGAPEKRGARRLAACAACPRY